MPELDAAKIAEMQAKQAADAQAKKEAKAKEKAERDAVRLANTANGVVRPKSGTMTGKIWEISDEISRVTQKAADRAQVLEKAAALGLNASTAATQYGRWRKYHGLKTEPKPPKPPKSAATPTGSDVSTQAAPTA